MKFKIFIIITLVILAFIFLLFFLRIHQPNKKSINSPQVVIIGLDGAGWNLINPLLEDKKLPNLRNLMKKGSYGTLKTIKPTKSAVIWTSIATGKSMVKHGIVDWTYVNNNNIVVPYRRSERRAKTFWNILSEKGIRVGVINWFITFPPEKVNGFMVSEEFRHGGRRDLSEIKVTYPRGLQKKLHFTFQNKKDFPKILEEEKMPDYRRWEWIGEGPKKLAPFFANFVIQEKTVELASLYLYKKFLVDVFATYFRLIDVVSHFACGYIDPQLLEKGMEEEKKGEVSKETLALIDRAFSKIVEPIYSYSDRILGRFLKLTNSQTTFIVISDHGFCFHNGGYGHYDTPRIPHGIILIKGPHIKKRYKIRNAHIYDIAPTILYLLDLPVAKDMDGKVLTEVFEEGFLKKRPIRYIESYEGEVGVKEEERKKVLDEKLLEELRALGYIK
ncbi:MAG: alkaline phosphatase family protein [Candidatus Aminicenantia bacterium]